MGSLGRFTEINKRIYLFLGPSADLGLNKNYKMRCLSYLQPNQKAVGTSSGHHLVFGPFYVVPRSKIK